MNELIVWGSGIIGGVVVAAIAGMVYLTNCAVVAVIDAIAYTGSSLEGLGIAVARFMGV